jgi:hypothetical protein
MQRGAGVGGRKTGARTPTAQRGLSAAATLPVLNGFDQDPRDILRCFLASLPGSGLRVESDVTYSKQTTAPFLPGARTAPRGLRQGTAFYPEPRRAAVPNAAQPSGVSTPEAHCRARSSIANALSNRELELLEPRLTLRKQTIAPRSNRELSTNRCRFNSHAAMPVLTFLTGLPRAFFAKGSVCAPRFLTGTASQTEFAVTHSKQTTAPFLTGSRIVTNRLGSRIVFHPVSSEHFVASRRISLQGRIARLRLVAGRPRMHAIAGRC